jgi:hypothetical protein
VVDNATVSSGHVLAADRDAPGRQDYAQCSIEVAPSPCDPQFAKIHARTVCVIVAASPPLSPARQRSRPPRAL